jgi:hypothetical protein
MKIMNFISSLVTILIIIALAFNVNLSEIYSQPTVNETSTTNQSTGSQFIVNVRGISSFTEKNMAALVSTENDVQVKKINLDDAVIEPGQEDSFSPSKMIDVTIVMNKQVEPNTEVMACVIQLGSGIFSQRVNCNTVFSESGNAEEPQKIIVPLA